MLAVPPLGNPSKDGKQGEMEGGFNVDFPEFGDGNLLESIDFDDLFAGINDGDMLPDLEMDPEIIAADFSLSGGEESDFNSSEKGDQQERSREEDDKVSGLEFENSFSYKDDEIMSKRDEPETKVKSATDKETEKARKSGGAQSKNNNNQGKRKVKVDWTPELHRRFVQAVEQLGVDKAVPSRILELMGIDCLTRHNIASHLQKYRSHRKHLLAREVEAASWSQKRQIYGGVKRDNHMSPWVAPPTMGFPPNPMHQHPQHHQFRPLHVWGHPSMDPTLMHMWPKHLAPHPPPPPSWAPSPPPPPDPSFWHHHRVPNGLTPGTPCFPQPLPAATRFPAPPVPGIPPSHAIYKADPGLGVPATGQSTPQPIVDFQPSNESIDAAIGDVLSKPWLPLPLGLKPPSMDCVMGELQRQGIPKVPPSCA